MLTRTLALALTLSSLLIGGCAAAFRAGGERSGVGAGVVVPPPATTTSRR